VRQVRRHTQSRPPFLRSVEPSRRPKRVSPGRRQTLRVCRPGTATRSPCRPSTHRVRAISRRRRQPPRRFRQNPDNLHSLGFWPQTVERRRSKLHCRHSLKAPRVTFSRRRQPSPRRHRHRQSTRTSSRVSVQTHRTHSRFNLLTRAGPAQRRSSQPLGSPCRTR
jgi:hypothetical protein